MVKVISLGGSIVAPSTVNTAFLTRFVRLVETYLEGDSTRKLILVVGGGGPARAYQEAYRTVAAAPDELEQDWVGVAATRLNGQLLRAFFRSHCPDPVVTDPTGDFQFSGRILIGAGWKPGFSTDFDAVMLAERFGAREVINLSNIQKVYTADPRKDPNATPIDTINWADFRGIVGDEWTPGANFPFDPVATRKAAELGLKVVVAAGADIDNTRQILEERPFVGTTIGPD